MSFIISSPKFYGLYKIPCLGTTPLVCTRFMAMELQFSLSRFLYGDLRKTGFDSKHFHVGFVLDRVALGQICF
jgi:hypothetical protein